MNYQEALNAFVTEQLNEYDPISKLIDVKVEWDDGDRYDPTYGGGANTTPNFEIRAIYKNANGVIMTRTIDTAMTLEAMLKALLGMSIE